VSLRVQFKTDMSVNPLACRDEGRRGGKLPNAATSIADTFRRPERMDRTYAQTVLDERLIAKMDFEYNDDDIGSLEEAEEATRGLSLCEGNGQLQRALDEYRRNYRKGKLVVRTSSPVVSTDVPAWLDLLFP
jgi:hypothetical protein